MGTCSIVEAQHGYILIIGAPHGYKLVIGGTTWVQVHYWGITWVHAHYLGHYMGTCSLLGAPHGYMLIIWGIINIKLYCRITNAKIANESIKYYLNKTCFNFTSTTFTACYLPVGCIPVR